MGEHPAGHMYDTPLPLTRETAPLPLHPSGVGRLQQLPAARPPDRGGPLELRNRQFSISSIIR